jgi:hypothetical protein
VLALSGDYPVTGHRGLAAPVFDIDSVGLLSLFSDMNAGLRDTRRPDTRLDRMDFFLGSVVTNGTAGYDPELWARAGISSPSEPAVTGYDRLPPAEPV